MKEAGIPGSSQEDRSVTEQRMAEQVRRGLQGTQAGPVHTGRERESQVQP